MDDLVLQKFLPNLPSSAGEKLNRLSDLYSTWNSKINVVSRKDIEHLMVRHVLHSLSVYKFCPFQPQSKILDIGTGGGFPGIPLAIVMPEVQFFLVDSIGKKIKVVQEIASELQLSNVTAAHQRAELVKGKFDFVVSRAVAPLSELLQWSRGKFSNQHLNAIPNGLICLKGGDLLEEIKAAKTEVQQFAISDWFNDPFFETKALLYLPV
jgi:16S rRNA (guanine527-N7)-methyltransferase